MTAPAVYRHGPGGHLTNTGDPGWCVYCGSLDLPAARQGIIVRAAVDARRQRRARLLVAAGAR
ncbi:hypothetical protein [Frankia sp. AvcI1]|uniref:hypothetical protein n=1 Tax=Frankia sp. AvcI1 TaxID=573496 RepID=UPI002117A26E|nr:hypothetical protein [Frankia sp. AvcI1]